MHQTSLEQSTSENEGTTTPAMEGSPEEVAPNQQNKKPKSEHEQTDLMPLLFPEKTVKVCDLSTEDWETYQRRTLVLERIEIRGGSVIKYLDDLETDQEERKIVGLKDGDKVWNAATVFKWKGKMGDVIALSRSVGGIGRHGAMSNWMICYTLDHLEFKPKSKAIDVFRGMKDFGNHFGYETPSYGRVARFLSTIRSYGGIHDLHMKVKTRKYHSQYAMSFENVHTYSNQRWQTDATKLPIWLMNDKGKKAYQPWLLLTVDCASGLPMGWTIPDWKSVKDEDGVLRGNDADTNDVISHLKFCMLPKSKMAFWGGKPTFLQSDNGGIYRAQNLRDVADQLEINLRHSPPYCPSANGGIERLNQTVKSCFGAKFTEFLVKRKFFSTQRQLFVGTLDDLRRHFEDFIIEYANTHKRNGCKETLFANWHANLRTPDEAFADEGEVDAKCLHYGTFPITRQGIFIREVYFRDPEGVLQPSKRGKKNATVLVRYNPDGVPSTAIARIANRDIRMVRNIKAEKEMMEFCKNAQAGTKKNFIELGEILKETSLQTAEFHSPYAAETLRNQPEEPIKKKPEPKEPAPLDPPVKIVIPKVIKYPSK